MTLGIRTFSTMTLSIKGLFFTRSITTPCIECYCAECRYAEYHVLFIVLVYIIMLGVVCRLYSDNIHFERG